MNHRPSTGSHLPRGVFLSQLFCEVKRTRPQNHYTTERW